MLTYEFEEGERCLSPSLDHISLKSASKSKTSTYSDGGYECSIYMLHRTALYISVILRILCGELTCYAVLPAGMKALGRAGRAWRAVQRFPDGGVGSQCTAAKHTPTWTPRDCCVEIPTHNGEIIIFWMIFNA